LYTQSGVYIDTIINSFGCDSIVTLNLTIDTESDSIIYITACDSLVWNGITYTASGVYTDTILNNSGCETFTHLYLTINNPGILSTQDTICFGYSVTLDSFEDTVFGQYDTIAFAQFQMYTTSLFNYSTPVTNQGVLYAIKVSGVFNISDVKYYDGAYLFADTNSNIVTPNFIVRWNFNGSLQLQNPLIPIPGTYNIDHDYWYYFIGDGNPMSFEFIDWPYTDNAGSLDFSVFELLENSNSTYLWSTGETTSSITVTPSQTTTYWVTQIINGVSCTDSIILTILDTSLTSVNITSCDTYTWSVNNQTYITSGTYTDISTNAAGCTHTEILNLTIDNSTSNTTPIIACDTYTWSVNNQTYTTSGTYTDISINAAGCTYTEILNLTINPLPAPGLIWHN
jgi:hypothetical protein